MDMNTATTPRISVAQNTDDCRRLVAAQARLYSDAKSIFFGRIIAVFFVAIATIAITTVWPDYRALIGGAVGIALFAASLIAEGVEMRRRIIAAGIQEAFDTKVFQLPWNGVHTTRPSMIAVTRAASRYTEDRDRNWYDDTKETIRPLDVLICQSSNLGWGSTMHRIWAWILVVVTGLVVALVAIYWTVRGLAPDAAILGVVLPILAPVKELVSQVRANFENASTKESAEQHVSELWVRGLAEDDGVDEGDVRSVQDKILILRQTNAYVPDWLDSALHNRNEAAMRASVSDRVAEAKRCGKG